MQTIIFHVCPTIIFTYAHNQWLSIYTQQNQTNIFQTKPTKFCQYAFKPNCSQKYFPYAYNFYLLASNNDFQMHSTSFLKMHPTNFFYSTAPPPLPTKEEYSAYSIHSSRPVFGRTSELDYVHKSECKNYFFQKV